MPAPKSLRQSSKAQASFLTVVNRQRGFPLDHAQVRQWVQEVLAEKCQEGELAVQFVSVRRSAELNRQFLQHEGPTDIITFDYGSTRTRLCGELFICVAEADRQAREWGTSRDEELQRYVVHGLLHLRGFDDREPGERRRMKREENRLLRRFSTLDGLG